MSQLSISELVLAARRTVHDTGAGRNALIRDEQLSGIDGANKRFSIRYFPIVDPVSPTFELRKNGTLLTRGAGAGEYQLDAVNGIVTMGTAPIKGPPMDVLTATYFFTWFDDTAFYEFLADAATTVGFPPTGTTAATRAQSVATNFPDTMLDALLQFVGFHFNVRRADENAHRFPASGAGQSVNTDVVTNNFRKLAQEFYERGIAMRDDFYKRRGSREAPSAAIGSFQPTPSVTGPYGSPRR